MKIGLIATTAVILGLGFSAQAKKEFKKEAPAMAAAAMKIDAAASEVTWTGKKVLIDSAHTGTITIKSGNVMIANNNITGGQFELDMTSINNKDLAASPSDKGKLEGHLKSADFFDVQKFPTASFKVSSSKVLPASTTANAPTHEVTGDLTIKGKTLPVTFPVTVKSTADGKTEATAAFKIDRTKWDVRYGSDKFFKGLGDKVIANDIDFTLKLVATK